MVLRISDDGPVRTLTLDRPEALNALTPALLEELADALESAADALELALACDLMVVAEEAKMGDTHTKFDLRPTWG
jgi:enoyl-CoA hydratase/carnithine racemase